MHIQLPETMTSSHTYTVMKTEEDVAVCENNVVQDKEQRTADHQPQDGGGISVPTAVEHGHADATLNTSASIAVLDEKIAEGASG